MDFFKKYRTAILVSTAVVLLGIVFSTFSSGKKDTGALVSDRALGTSENAVGKELLSLLLTLKSLDLKEDIFADPAFRRLEDFSLELAPQPVGRSNPFAPFGASEAR